MNYIIDCKRVDIAPVTEPVTLAEAKTQLRVDFADDDTEITALIKRARWHIENYCNISIVYKRITLLASLASEWELPYGPVIALEAVNTNQGQTGSGPVTYEPSTTDWRINGDWFGGNAPGYSPFVNNRYPDYNIRYQLIYTAGMATVPDDLKQGILLQVAFLYENRGKDAGTKVCEQARDMVNPYRKLWI